MTKENWLENLKPGDEVIVSGWGVRASDSIARVERLTKTQVILEDIPTRFRVATGRSIGTTRWHHLYLRQGTYGSLAKVREAQFRRRSIASIRRCDLDALPTDRLRRIVDIIEEVG